MKYSGLQFGKMGDENLWAYANSTLLKIHVITGWTIPTNKIMEVLIDQFIKKIKEGYSDTNPEEWEYAFRNYGTTVKDWGKSMNLSLIDEVMIPYLSDRKHLSHEVEERKEPPPMKILNDFELDNLRRQWTEEFYQRLKAGAVENIPQYCQEILSKDGFIGEGETLVGFFVRVLGEKRKALYERV